MEELFTYEEISAILMEATNPEYKIENLWHPTFSKCEIFRVSKKGLIFVHGNSDTGMEHINERHSITSRKLYKKEEEYETPTKFNLAPMEYPFVADIIYTPSNLDVKKNKLPDQFELYTGPFTQGNGKTYIYTLIVYKFTGIVHTFFISKQKPFNKKVNLPLRQGWTSSTHNMVTLVSVYTINYRDILDEIRFRILLISNPISGVERWYLEVYKDKEAIFTHFLKEESASVYYDHALRFMQLDGQDMSSVDKIIKKIINGKYDFGNGFGIFWFYEY